MKTILTALLFFVISNSPLARAGEPPAVAIAETPPASPRLTPQRPLPKSWEWSLAPLAASQTLDITSSYGMRELNPWLAGSRDEFGGKAAMLKVGTTAALIGVEYLIVKAHPRAARAFTKINWAGAALTTGFAIHNFSIR